MSADQRYVIGTGHGFSPAELFLDWLDDFFFELGRQVCGAQARTYSMQQARAILVDLERAADGAIGASEVALLERLTSKAFEGIGFEEMASVRRSHEAMLSRTAQK